MSKLAFIGNPISHSLSPTIFELFSKQFNIKLSCEKVLITAEDEFKSFVKEFFKQEGLALCVTSPYKSLAFEIADTQSTRANFCRASNFLRLDTQGKILADTTDGIGLSNDLELNHNINIANKKILILGSGFVLDSVLLDLIVKNPLRLDILARNYARVNYLKGKFAIGEFKSDEGYDLIINTVPNNVENSLLNYIKSAKANTVCYDMAYSKDTNFLKYMKELNPQVITINGLGMLVEQAKVTFMTLFNQIPDTIKVINTLKELINH